MVGIEYSDGFMERSLRRDGFCFQSDAETKGYRSKLSRQTTCRLTTYLKSHYRSLVGSLIYIMIACRPDLCFAVGKLSRHMHDPVHRILISYLVRLKRPWWL